MNKKYIYRLFILFFAGAPWSPAGAQLQPGNSVHSWVPSEEGGLIPEPLSVPSEEGAQESLPAYAELKQAVERYSERVSRVETENGAYHPGLQEELLGLGQAWLGLGAYEDALAVFTRAMHINRINEGLYSLGQLGILDRIIDANTGLNDFGALIDNYHYLLWVNDRNYTGDDLRRVSAYERAAKWHLDTSAVALPDAFVHHLVLAANLYSKIIDMIETAGGPDTPDLINALYGVVVANSRLIEPFGFIENVDAHIERKYVSLLPSNFEAEPDADRMRNDGEYPVLEFSSQRISRLLKEDNYLISLVQNSYKSGRNALLRIVDIHAKNPDLPVLSRAQALADMGDWYLRFYKRSRARSYYEQAYAALSETGYSEGEINRLFGRPRPLGIVELMPEFEIDRIRITASENVDPPPDQDMPVDLSDKSLANTRYVLARFAVTKYGSVKNLKIIASNPEDSYRFWRTASLMINATPFRPQMKNGELVDTDNVTMLYRFE